MRALGAAFLLMLGLGFSPARADGAGAGSGHGTGADPSGQKLPAPSEAPLFQISVNSDAKTATASVAFGLPDAQYVTISAQSPVAQGANFANIVTLDGLAKATSIKLKYTFVTGSFVRAYDDNSDYYKAKCRSIMASVNAPVPPPPAKCVAEFNVANELTRLRESDKKLSAELFDAAHPPVAVRRAQIDAELQQNHKNEGVLTRGQKALQSTDEISLGPFWMVGMTGQVGYNDHKYFDPTSLMPMSGTKTPFDIGIEVTRVFDNGHASINLGFDYQESYQDGNKGAAQVKCTNAATAILSCVNGFIGAPTFQQKDLIRADLRYLIKPFGIPIGIDPGITYDAKSNTEAVQFPIYLMSSTSGGLTGGIRYDWVSDKHVSIVGIFASAAFSTFDNL